LSDLDLFKKGILLIEQTKENYQKIYKEMKNELHNFLHLFTLSF